jgi:hypothetical protein
MRYRRATEDSILAIQIFDQKKFKKKDQGFLGVINVRIGDVIDLDAGGEGNVISLTACLTPTNGSHRDAYPRLEEVNGQPGRSRKIDSESFYKFDTRWR